MCCSSRVTHDALYFPFRGMGPFVELHAILKPLVDSVVAESLKGVLHISIAI
jgi:hypothetical protein